MSALYVYLLFSYMFMVGVALSELASGKKKVSAPYFVAILISPLAFPFVLGYELVSKD